FLDINPVNKGHVLVIPKKHFETYIDLPDEEVKSLSIAVKNVAKAVKLGIEADGFNIQMNNHESAGQVVPHVHFHIVPRFKDDGLKLWDGGEYNESEMEETKKKIIQRL
ncbi:HIT domain-containing protein, partial [Candidatus Woesearchaeota archaeon]|nr:HIT domain-containing protein [Candidatus Woesearchaeota archaeon]